MRSSSPAIVTAVIGMWFTLPVSSEAISSVNFPLIGFLLFRFDKFVSKKAIESFRQIHAIWRRSWSIRKLTQFGELLSNVNVAAAPGFFSSSATFHKDKLRSVFDALIIKESSSWVNDWSDVTFAECPVNVCKSCELLLQTLMLFEAVAIFSPALMRQMAVGLSGPQSNEDSCWHFFIFHFITLASRPDVKMKSLLSWSIEETAAECPAPLNVASICWRKQQFEQKFWALMKLSISPWLLPLKTERVRLCSCPKWCVMSLQPRKTSTFSKRPGNEFICETISASNLPFDRCSVWSTWEQCTALINEDSAHTPAWADSSRHPKFLIFHHFGWLRRVSGPARTPSSGSYPF